MPSVSTLLARRNARKAAEAIGIARVLASDGKWDDAARAYEAAIARDATHADWFAELGYIHRRRQAWDDAARAYDAALRLDGSSPAWMRALARTHERREDWDAARAAYGRWLTTRARVTQMDRTLLALKPWRFPARRKIVRVVAKALPRIREEAAAAGSPPAGGTRSVFVYWAQGMDHAPEIVRLCRRELLRHHEPGSVVELDATTVADVVDLPGSLWRALEGDPTHLSDVLRVALLHQRGGIWLDATCLVTGNVIDEVDRIAPSGFFAFDYGDARIASWFMAGERGNYIAGMMMRALIAYWSRFETLMDYYLIHHIFEALYLLDERFKAEWDAGPRVSQAPAHAVQGLWGQPHDAEALGRALAGSVVHKLTYKFEGEPGSNWDVFLRDLRARA